MIPKDTLASCAYESVPRVGGGDPGIVSALETRLACSPRRRG